MVALLGLLSRQASGVSADDDGLNVVSNIVYDVKTRDDIVHVSWDVSITNEDPQSVGSGNGALYYYSLSVPVVRGAANASATDGDGTPLDVSVADGTASVAQSATVDFAERLFYQDTYAFRLTYEIPQSHSQGILVTPHYAFVPLLAGGDEATVTVNTPSGGPWEVSVEPQECDGSGNTFHCSGSESGGYLAALAEVSDPTATATRQFAVPVEDTTVNVTLSYFLGEEETAAHQEQVITAALPVIEQVYGFTYPGPGQVNIVHGGRQAVLGYEGLTSCGLNVCEVVVSPVADDYTLIHELSHLWSSVFDRRWLSEGFAQLVTEETAPQLPAGLVQGQAPDREAPTATIQLDDWGDVQPLIGAPDDERSQVAAGYYYSLGFLQELRSEYGMETLRAVVRNIAGSGSPADSRRFMDVLEQATGDVLDDKFLAWVFPDSYEPILEDRREAIIRAAGLRTSLAEQELREDALIPIEQHIRDWNFGEALAALDEAEAGLETYAALSAELDDLERAVGPTGLVLPDDISQALADFDFEAARNLLDSGNAALRGYVSAAERVDEGRSLWQRFGLIGSDPEGELRAAKTSFESGQFTNSRERSQHAESLIEDASAVAFRRMLVVAGLLGLLAAALGIAFTVSHLRQREWAER